ncbi:hypothetical protein GEV33_014408 [Tenebrio molitor]|uniref:RNA polymerase-associated protein LEO1 n=1 Tax=Tenebrio molitor TaxID=7067 RepID=A0A8J6H6X7_TENMO|nr:hypothetical protein GEV33_014408 [Tenebrio molitor]
MRVPSELEAVLRVHVPVLPRLVPDLDHLPPNLINLERRKEALRAVNQTDLDRQDLTSQVLLLKGLDQTDQSHLLDHVDHDQAVQAQRSQDLDRRALLVTDPDPDLGVLQVTNLDPSRDHALDQEVLLPTDQNLLNQTDLRVQEKAAESRDNSRSNSPNLQIDEPGSPESGKGDKRKRDSSEERSVKKKNRVIDSDSEEEGKEDGKVLLRFLVMMQMISVVKKKRRTGLNQKKKPREVKKMKNDIIQNMRLSKDKLKKHEEDKENEPEPIPETRIDVEIPKISCDLGRDIHFVKLPNFLSVETRPFDPETYEDEIDEEETLDEEGRARLKLKVENTIRWKEVMDKEGTIKKESNARLVRWSDGSYSLHLGSEIFDVYKQPLQGDHNHLFIRQGTGLQGQAVFRTKLSFRPHSTESFTHRKMTLSLADRSQKTSGIKILSQVGADPDHDRKLLLKKEEEKLRQTVRMSKPRRKGDSGTRSHNSSVYREEDGSDEEGAISLNAIKNKYKSGAATAAKGGAIYSSDEEGSDIEARRARKLDKAKVLKDSESSEESE